MAMERHDSPATGGRGKATPAWAVLLILALTNLVYILDRTAPVIIAEEVRKEFRLSDSELGLFTGLAYGMSFAIMGLISGPLVDRFNRSRLLAGMLLIWSGLTSAGATVTAFWQLLTLRFAVGAAEAGGSPAILSILSDVFPPNRRGLAIGLYGMGQPLGFFAASAGCGWLASEFGWRIALLAAGIPGILLALAIIRWVPEPVRGAAEMHPMPSTDTYSVTAALRMLRSNSAIIFLILGLTTFAFANVGMQSFIIPLLGRVHGVPLAEAASYFALAALLGGFSPLVLGIVHDRLIRKGNHRAAQLAAMIAGIVFAAGSLMVLANEVMPAIVGLVVWQTLTLGMAAINYAAILTLTPPAYRGSIMAALLVATVLIGVGLGPVAVGVLSDLMGGGHAIRHAGLAMLCLNLAAAALYLLAAARTPRMTP